MMECLGLIKIHSPLRDEPNRVVKGVPSRNTIFAARIASKKILERVGAGSSDPLGSCCIVAKQKVKRNFPSSIRTAIEHQKHVKGTTMHPLEHSQLCTMPSK